MSKRGWIFLLSAIPLAGFLALLGWASLKSGGNPGGLGVNNEFGQVDISSKPAAEFTLALNSGNEMSLSDLRGKVVLVDFWASWCGPCRISLPVMDQLFNEFNEQGFTVVAVNLDKNISEAKAFLKDHPVSYPLIRDDGSLPKRFGVQGMPTAFLVDHTGTVRAVHEGFRKGDEKKLRAQIVRLLNEAKAAD